MKNSEIELGAVYTAKVSGKLTSVRIVTESQYGGWNAVNTATDHQIRIKSAQRLRRKVELLAFYLDTESNESGSSTKQINRSEAIALVHEAFGVGTWLESLSRMRRPEGLEINGGTLRARTTA